MGTRGYRVYRYRDIYFIKYNHHDSYPEGFAVEVLNSMQWHNAIALMRQELGEILDELDGQKLEHEDDSGNKISKQRPRNDLFIEWIYEIDLDRNIFHINGIPFFSLECLPDSSAFLDYVSQDHYGHMTCAPTCPPKQKYKRPAPPAIDDSEIATYRSLVCTGTQVALSDLLDISDALSPDEHVRVSLLETMIGQCMIRDDVAHVIHDLGLISSPGQLTDDFWLLATSMANFAFIPQMFDAEFNSHPPRDLEEEFIWLREDTVLYNTTHLYDERCLQASLSRLINEILKQMDGIGGDFFGIAFSVFHCVIIKVAKDEHATTFSHTAAFEFIPSFYADSPSTPGITAFARLGYRIDSEIFFRATDSFRRKGRGENKERVDNKESIVQGADDATPPSIGYAELLPELWLEVALHLHLSDLLTFGSVSKSCREIASMVLRYPYICGYRLVAVAEDKPKRMMQNYGFLHASCFIAERADIPGTSTLLVGLARHKRGADALVGMSIPFCHPHTSLFVRVSAEVQSEVTAEDDEEDFDMDPDQYLYSFSVSRG